MPIDMVIPGTSVPWTIENVDTNVLDFGIATLLQNSGGVGNEIKLITANAKSTISQMKANTEGLKSMEPWQVTRDTWPEAMKPWPTGPGSEKVAWDRTIEMRAILNARGVDITEYNGITWGQPDAANQQYMRWNPDTDIVTGMPYAILDSSRGIYFQQQEPVQSERRIAFRPDISAGEPYKYYILYRKVPGQPDIGLTEAAFYVQPPNEAQLFEWNTLLRGPGSLAATRDIESKLGVNVSESYNAYKITTKDNVVTYQRTAQPAPADATVEGFVLNPTPGQITDWLAKVPGAQLEAKSERLLLDGIEVERSAPYDTAKYLYDGKVGYSPLPPTVVDDPATVTSLGTLVQKKDTNLFYRITAAGPVEVSSPLPPAKDVIGLDFTALSPGDLAKSNNGKYYRVMNNGKGVEVSFPLLKLVMKPTDAQLADWRDQYSSLNTALGKTSLTEQVYLQELTGKYSMYLNAVTNLLSDKSRILEKLIANI
ncbi:MAG: hypothetical protein JWQ23_2401 [Herminiimonas sp.]|nr:hypothetical protein [Herminiimonas sp.]